jgi:hypothetical protein
VVETFNADYASEVGVEHCFRSLGAQEYPTERLEILVFCPTGRSAESERLRPLLGPHAAVARWIEIPAISYRQAKEEGFRLARAPVVALADVDVEYPSHWLQRIHKHLVEGDDAVVCGAVTFRPRSALRTLFILADWSLLHEDGVDWPRYFNLNNAAFRREVVLRIIGGTPASYRRFGQASYFSRAVREAGLRVRLDREMLGRHGFTPASFLFEKRMRRYAHASTVARDEPGSGMTRVGVPERPGSWLRAWWNWARRYQSRPARCRKDLDLSRMDLAVQHALLAGLSAWELVLIGWLALMPGAHARLVKRYGW